LLKPGLDLPAGLFLSAVRKNKGGAYAQEFLHGVQGRGARRDHRALNWGMMALFHTNMVEYMVGMGLANWIYLLVGVSGILLLVSFVYVCPLVGK
jgi:hypothetical protein